MSQETILVTGAAGGVGSTAHTAIAILLEQRHRVRAMVRKLDARADTLRDMGAEIVVADMLDIIAVRAAMQGCSGVYFTMSIGAHLPGSGHQRCSRSQEPGREGLRQSVTDDGVADERDRNHKQSATQAALARRADVALVGSAGGLPASDRFLRRHVPAAGGQGHSRG